MRNFYIKSVRLKKVYLLIILLLFGSIISIISNYRDTGVFKLFYKKVPIYSVETKDKKIALTFDLSWGNDNTSKILDILDEYKVKATFFLVGAWIDDNENLVKDIVKRGHELGNHTNKHPDMTKISKEKMLQDIMSCEAKIIAISGQSTKLFRCPSGAYNDLVIETVQNAGYYCIQWDVDSIDWKEHGADIEYNRVIKKTKPGSILLYHNTAKYTPETLPKVIKKLQEDGYSFVKVSDLIYKNNFYIDAAGKQISK
ncbi:polysaccharide deacetylase family sporulation protein PdaB [Clostridium sp. SYSU_GA19001]|uniref:polysaccharide deacetylase family sporulation protein PdaB n=1 Tax=Clostridium caldaquaticum TaxID=2940653 RepID=UPI00207771C5|nr:polysaccharide deacetylase family sporulation protein PdaB [Clostridium caldaquaticum]MCM8711630.1 polysaccharide deacetylase family sporulation protein PdaB [Clostridium caldaquaticum]